MEELRDESPPESPARRKLLAGVTLALGAVAGALALVPFVGFLISPLRRPRPQVWRDIGALDDFPVGATLKVTYLDPQPLPWAGLAAESAAWVRRTSEEKLVGFSAYCTHVGCPVRWMEGAQLFFCPCHGGAFHADGRVAAGPPPRPLPTHEIRVRQGLVQLRTRAIHDV